MWICILYIVSRLIKGGKSLFYEEEDGQEKSTGILSMLMRIDRHFMGKCFGQLQEVGIYPGQLPVLEMVACFDGLSQREIAEKLNIKPPTVNVSVQRLEKAGFICRKPDEKDQRVTRIFLTEKGKESKNRGLEMIRINEKIMLDGFSETEICLLRRFLVQIAENIEKIPAASCREDSGQNHIEETQKIRSERKEGKQK